MSCVLGNTFVYLSPCAPAAVAPHLVVMAKAMSVGDTPDTEGRIDDGLCTAHWPLSIKEGGLHTERSSV